MGLVQDMLGGSKFKSMASKDGRAFLGGYVAAADAERFRALADGAGGVSALLRQLVARETRAATDAAPEPAGAACRSVHVRLGEREREALRQRAAQAGMTPAAYLRALARAHLLEEPQWSRDELAALTALADQVRRVGVNVNQIALRLNTSASASENPRGQGRAAKEAAELVRAELAKLAAISGGNLARFGVRAVGQERRAGSADGLSHSADRALSARRTAVRPLGRAAVLAGSELRQRPEPGNSPGGQGRSR